MELVVAWPDARRRFVPGLSAADFDVLEDGEPQTDRVAGDGGSGGGARRGRRSRSAEPDVRSNERPFAGRVWVLALDAINTAADRSANVRQIARLFVERALGPDDLDGGRDARRSSGASQDLTNSRRRLLQAIEPFVGESVAADEVRGGHRRPACDSRRAPSPGPPARASRTSASIELARQENALKVAAQDAHGRRLGGVGARPPQGDRLAERGHLTRRDQVSSAPTGWTHGARRHGRRPRDPRHRRRHLPRRRQHLRHRHRRPHRRIGGQGSRPLARAVEPAPDGGEHRRVRPDQLQQLRAAFDRIVRENSAYYVLTYSPAEPRSATAAITGIRVRVKRPGVTARTREGYLSPRARAEAHTPLVVDAGLSPELRERAAEPAAGVRPAAARVGGPVQGRRANGRRCC